MNFQLVASILVLGLWVSVAVWVWRVHRRAGRHPGRACPQCGYDLRGRSDSRRCSECGHEAGHESELIAKPLRFSGHRVTVGIIVLVTAPCFIFPLTYKLSTSWLYYPAVEMWASIMGPDAVITTGKVLPHPTVSKSGSLYNHLVWDRQHAQAMQAWIDLVLQCDGSAEELEGLVPAAREIQAMNISSRGSAWHKTPFSRSLWHHFYDQKGVVDARSPVPLGSWIFSELQTISGNMQAEWFWTPPPREIMEVLAESGDRTVRLYVLEKITVVEFQWADDVLRRMLNDGERQIVKKAKEALRWRSEYSHANSE